jgi:hypothetical protein
MGERGRAILVQIGRARMSGVLCVVLAVVTGVSGYWLGSSRERHSATAMVLTGTVIWSNEKTGLIAFETDGVVRYANGGDTIYSVLGDNWQDLAGTFHSGDAYPTCLASEGDGPISMDRHRVELTVIDWATGGVQPVHVAVRVHCLD